MLENNASVKDMEAAAIAYVAELAGVPFFGVKVVTDIVDGDRPTQVLYFRGFQSTTCVNTLGSQTSVTTLKISY
jgi:nucleoside phosphorylase